MDGGNVAVGGKFAAVGGYDSPDFPVGDFKSADFATGDHLAAVRTDHSGQSVGKLLASADKPARPVEIEHVDERVDICRGVAGAAAVEWIEIGENFPQFGVGNVAGDQLVGRH